MTTSCNTPARRPALRFPLEPIMRLTRCESYQELALRLGATGDAVRQWSVRGLSSRPADEVATELGYHPLAVWPNFNDDLFEELWDEIVDDLESDGESVQDPAPKPAPRRSFPVSGRGSSSGVTPGFRPRYGRKET